MISLLDSRSIECSWVESWLGTLCCTFLGKTLYSHSASLHPGVQMGASKLNAGGNPVMDQHPIQGGVEILLVTSCYRNWDKLQPGFSSMKQPGVFLLSPGWGASPSQGYPPALNCRYPLIHLGGGRYCESKVSCPITQRNIPGQGSNQDRSIRVQRTSASRHLSILSPLSLKYN